MRYLFCFLFIISCGTAADKAEKKDPDQFTKITYEFAAQRLVTEFLDRGFVVSLKEDGEPEHKGDALIWSGVAMSALDCDKGTVIEDAAIKMITDLNGGLYRHPDLPNEISLDGALGLYHGIASRIARCESLSKWAHPLKLHKEFTSKVVPKEFTYVRDLLFHKAGIAGEPSKDRLKILEGQIYGWASAVMISKSACFRLHLSYLSYSTIEKLGGGVSRGGRGRFCSATDGADLPLIDHWCGRDGLTEWIANFEVDQYEYRHQRCPWEGPDRAGLRYPGVDFLKGIEDAYNL